MSSSPAEAQSAGSVWLPTYGYGYDFYGYQSDAAQPSTYDLYVSMSSYLQVDAFIDNPWSGNCSSSRAVVRVLASDRTTEVSVGRPEQAGGCTAVRALRLEPGQYFVSVDGADEVALGSFGLRITGSQTNICGNGVVEAGEICDPGPATMWGWGASSCPMDCRPPTNWRGYAYLPNGYAQDFPGGLSIVQSRDRVDLWVSYPTYLNAETLGLTAGACGADTLLRVFQYDGVTEIAHDEDSGVDGCSRLTNLRLESGSYTLLVEEQGNDATISAYTLRVSGAQADMCGNGVVERGETCDEGPSNGGLRCGTDCQLNVEDPRGLEAPGTGVALSPFDRRLANETPVIASFTYGRVLASLRYELGVSLGTIGGPGLAPQYEAAIRLRGGRRPGNCGKSCKLLETELLHEGSVFTLVENDGALRRFEGEGADFDEVAPKAGTPFVGATLHVLADGSVAVVERDHTVRTFDANGHLVSLANAFGEIRFDYDADGQLVRATDTKGEVLAFTYQNGLLTSATSPSGTLTLEYAGRNLTAVAGPAFSTFSREGLSFTWMSTMYGDELATIAEAGKRALQIWYDWNGRVATVDDVGGTQHRFRADAEHVAVSDSRGMNMSTEYVSGRPASVVSNEGDTKTFTYDESGNLIEERTIGASGESFVTYTYDEAGRTATLVSSGATAMYVYANTDPNAFPAQLIESDDLGNETVIAFDAVGQMVSRTQHGHTETWAYNGDGDMIEHVDFFGNRTTRVLDTRGLPLAITKYGATERFAYDAHGQTIAVTDAFGRLRQHDYDDKGTLVGTHGEGIPEMRMQKTGSEVRVSVGGREKTYTLDALNRVVATRSGNSSTTIGYDGVTGKASSWDRLVNGRRWVETVSYNNTGSVETHDVNSRRQKSADAVTTPGAAADPVF